MEDLGLLVDLHREGARQGPGGDAETRLALRLSGLEGATGLRIADIGCGTGASARLLARELDATVTAVDFLPEFLRELEAAAEREGLADRIGTLAASMEALPFEDGAFDAIWAEGAIYIMGFAAGVKAWRRFLKPGGVLAVSELTWLTRDRPEELERHWMEEPAFPIWLELRDATVVECGFPSDSRHSRFRTSARRPRGGPRPAGPGSRGVETSVFGHACSVAGVAPNGSEGVAGHAEAASAGGPRRPLIRSSTPAKTLRGSAASANWKTA